jgi:hypothetical protein
MGDGKREGVLTVEQSSIEVAPLEWMSSAF